MKAMEILNTSKTASSTFYRVASPSGNTYIVRNTGESWFCTCPDYVYRSEEKPDHQCKHIVNVIELTTREEEKKQ